MSYRRAQRRVVSLQGLEVYDTYVGDGAIITELRWGERSCGHSGIAHGGALAASFDDAFGSLFFSQGYGPGFTAHLAIDFRKPVPVGTPLRLHTEVTSAEGRKVWMRSRLVKAEASSSDGPEVLFAEAKSLFLKAKVPKALPSEAYQRS